MPMIDVYAPADIFPADADEQLGTELTHAVLRAEGVARPGAFHQIASEATEIIATAAGDPGLAGRT